jgi:putative dimethyl sulfoxide reductase chaperone
MKRIYMISSQLMFGAGLQTMLSEQSGIKIVGRDTDPTRALEQIRELHPDVVILDSKDLASTPGSIVADILRERPGIKVISLNLENDRMRIFHGELRIAHGLDDLMQVIEGQDLEPAAISPQEWTTLAAARAQVYSFHAAVYFGDMDNLLLENLPDSLLKIAGPLEHGEDLTGDLRQGMQALECFQQSLASVPMTIIKMGLMEEHARLLQGRKPGAWSAQACEAAYTNLDSSCADPLIIALNAVYAESGLKQTGRMLAQPDYIACELEFLQHLCSEEQASWSKNDRLQALKSQNLQCAFLHDHLIRWVPRFCDRLASQTRHDFFRGVAWLTKGFILNETYRVAELMEWTRLTADDFEDIS